MRSKLLNIAMTLALTITALPALGITTASADCNSACRQSQGGGGYGGYSGYGGYQQENPYKNWGHGQYRPRHHREEYRPRYREQPRYYREEYRPRREHRSDNGKTAIIGITALSAGILLGTMLNQPDN